ncbi:uncharacterized protein FOMMEDRAFT_171222 [Fomitiporia mediterranea MF3/22]|uniref:uncharacterized protein n=1 Tax=Fomitiporia mediterranea (strain MF3/22) TaxID=694068 RepID=UPI00044074CB|nr:uncharacterized protein FOMMEDRAFT_171222 [Fomitiporia mediterranea MF3/22]EJC98322.1 hypothetical protein FOMMEDRAFT_171222 [Fomitiporia mediterranea MF3/22]
MKRQARRSWSGSHSLLTMSKPKADELSKLESAVPREDDLKKARTEANLDCGGTTASDRHSSDATAARQSENVEISDIQDRAPVEQSETPKARKRTKSSRKKHTAKKHKDRKFWILETLTHMPFDIFCEIASHLSPLDLLNMSRTSKQLRAFLTSKGSKSIWRVARDAVKLPECPSDISEVQFADLLFSKGCSLCDSRRTIGLYFRLRMRLCSSCSDNNVVLGSEIEKDFQCDANFLNLLPRERRHRPGSLQWCFAVNEARTVWNQLQSLAVESAKYADFVAEREQKVKDILKECRYNAGLVERWWLERASRWDKEEKKIKGEREQAVFNKLKEIGYSQSDFDLSSESDTHYMRRRWESLVQGKGKRLLTERIWQIILPKLQEVISDRRSRRAMFEDFFSSDPECTCDECIETNVWIGEDDYSDYDDDDDDDCSGTAPVSLSNTLSAIKLGLWG